MMKLTDLVMGITFSGLILMGIHGGDVPEIDSGKWWKPNYDITDNPDDEKRSGLNLHIDHGTGCHYLVTKFGGITPRFDENKNQICDNKTFDKYN